MQRTNDTIIIFVVGSCFVIAHNQIWLQIPYAIKYPSKPTNPIMFQWVDGEFLLGVDNCHAELFNGILLDTSLQNTEVVSNRLLLDIAKKGIFFKNQMEWNLNKEQVWLLN